MSHNCGHFKSDKSKQHKWSHGMNLEVVNPFAFAINNDSSF